MPMASTDLDILPQHHGTEIVQKVLMIDVGQGQGRGHGDDWISGDADNAVSSACISL